MDINRGSGLVKGSTPPLSMPNLLQLPFLFEPGDDLHDFR